MQQVLDLSKQIISGETKLHFLEMDLTIEKNLSKKTIRSVFKGESAMLGYSVCEFLVKRFLESFGFSTKHTENQIEMITVDTLENFSYESLEDIILFFKMARSGSFGTTNRGIDSNLIYGEWFPMYLEIKAEKREQIYQKSKAETSRVQASDEDVAVTYKKIQDKLDIKKVEIYVDKITKYMDRQLLEDTIVDWAKDPIKKNYLHILKAKRKKI